MSTGQHHAHPDAELRKKTYWFWGVSTVIIAAMYLIDRAITFPPTIWKIIRFVLSPFFLLATGPTITPFMYVEVHASAIRMLVSVLVAFVFAVLSTSLASRLSRKKYFLCISIATFTVLCLVSAIPALFFMDAQ